MADPLGPLPVHHPSPAPPARPVIGATWEQTRARFGGRTPRAWGLAVPGTITHGPAAAVRSGTAYLTFDACGGHRLHYDAALVEVLRRRRVPATLFVNEGWARHNAAVLTELAADPLLEIANHGNRHVPLSVTGRSAYGIRGTSDLHQVWTEVTTCAVALERSWGIRTAVMRPGTAYADDVSAAVARFVGQPLAGFSVNADAGATLPPAAVTSALLRVRGGDIVIGHMNRPGSGTAAGLDAALPVLAARGVRFGHLQADLAAAGMLGQAVPSPSASR